MESPLAVPNTFDVFFWMTWLGTILFQGALHSCILLLLKAWKYEHAGTRWAKVIWINFFWIGCFFWLSSWIYEWGHTSSIDHFWIGIALGIHGGLSIWCLMKTARWAAYE